MPTRLWPVLFRFVLLIALSGTISFAGTYRVARKNFKDHFIEYVEGDTARINQLLRAGIALETKNPPGARALYRQAEQLLTHGNKILSAKVYNTLGWFYIRQSQYDSASVFFHRALRVHTTQPEKIEGYRGLAQIQLRKSAFDSAVYFLSTALDIGTAQKDYKSLAHIHNDWGNVAIEENDFVKALNEYLQTAQLYDSVLHDGIGSATALLNIGNVQYVLGNLDKAISYTNRGKQLAMANHHARGITFAYKLLGRIYRKQQKPDSALHQYQQALQQYEREGDKQNAAEIMQSVANIYYDKEEYTRALEALNKAMEYARAIEGPSIMPYIYSSKGFAYYALKQLDQARIYFDSSRILAQRTQRPYLVMDAYEMLSQVEKDKHHYPEALTHYERFTAIKDSLTQVENRQVVEEMSAKYESAQKESEISLLQKDKRINRIWTYTLTTILILVVLMAWLLLSRSKLKTKIASELAAKERQLGVQQKELLEAELRARHLEEERLKQEIDFKNKELTTYTLNLIQKNEVMEELRAALENLSKDGGNPVGNLIQKLNYSAHLDREWEGFKRYFEQVHTGFLEKLLEQYPELTTTEMKLCALLKLNLETKEIASLLGISPESAKVSRSRLRKKLNLEGDQNLSKFLATFR
ncbi:tetratricopeptide repeat protein [Ohtaekwangia sp.]|uniref:tetratricopeptide repeat protein n=1 Tax=Ohtaekwangia sp. TaxID=2066019 RepID=UPI002F937632